MPKPVKVCSNCGNVVGAPNGCYCHSTEDEWVDGQQQDPFTQSPNSTAWGRTKSYVGEKLADVPGISHVNGALARKRVSQEAYNYAKDFGTPGGVAFAKALMHFLRGK